MQDEKLPIEKSPPLTPTARQGITIDDVPDDFPADVQTKSIVGDEIARLHDLGIHLFANALYEALCAVGLIYQSDVYQSDDVLDRMLRDPQEAERTRRLLLSYAATSRLAGEIPPAVGDEITALIRKLDEKLARSAVDRRASKTSEPSEPSEPPGQPPSRPKTAPPLTTVGVTLEGTPIVHEVPAGQCSIALHRCITDGSIDLQHGVPILAIRLVLEDVRAIGDTLRIRMHEDGTVDVVLRSATIAPW